MVFMFVCCCCLVGVFCCCFFCFLCGFFGGFFLKKIKFVTFFHLHMKDSTYHDL